MMEIKEKTMYSYDENIFSDLYKDAMGTGLVVIVSTMLPLMRKRSSGMTLFTP